MVVDIRKYLESKAGHSFQWGKNDCYTLIRDYLRLRGIEVPELVYEDKQEALRLQAQYSWHDVLLERGFDSGSSLEEAHDGNILIVQTDQFECAHLIYQGKAWSIAENHRLISVPLHHYRDLKYHLHKRVC